MNAVRFLDVYLAMASARAAPPSPSGYQLDRVRLELPESLGRGDGTLNELRFAHLAYVVHHVLSPTERTVALALRQPRAHAHTCRQVVLAAGRAGVVREDDGRVVQCTCGAARYYQHEVRDGDLVVIEVENTDGTKSRWQQTHQGEWFLCSSQEGWAVVYGWRPVFATRESVARQFGLTDSELRRIVRAAHRKIDPHIWVLTAEEDAECWKDLRVDTLGDVVAGMRRAA